MGIFIKFECDTCGQYECDCSMEQRNIPKSAPVSQEIRLSKASPQVCQGDIICSEIDKEGQIGIDEFYVSRIDKEGSIFGYPVKNIRDGKEMKWEKKHIKICSVLIGEYDAN